MTITCLITQKRHGSFLKNFHTFQYFSTKIHGDIKHTVRKHQVKFQSEIKSLYEEIWDIMEQIDFMGFCSITNFLAIVA